MDLPLTISTSDQVGGRVSKTSLRRKSVKTHTAPLEVEREELSQEMCEFIA